MTTTSVVSIGTMEKISNIIGGIGLLILLSLVYWMFCFLSNEVARWTVCGNISSCIFDWGLAFTSYSARKIGDWLPSKSSFHARRGSANIYIFPECQGVHCWKIGAKGERGRQVQDSSRTSHQDWWIRWSKYEEINFYRNPSRSIYPTSSQVLRYLLNILTMHLPLYP